MVFIAFMVLVAIVLLGLGLAAIVNHRDRRITNMSGQIHRLDAENHTLKRDLHEAHKGLRAIANGAGNPPLEAQIVLDNYNSKELDA